MQRIIDEAKKMITAKAIISTTSLGLLIPFTKLIYWVFDTAYLGGFGVSPDVYSRPIFSSGFVSIWLVAETIIPILIGWGMFSLILFFVLFHINFGTLEKNVSNENMIKINDTDSFLNKIKKRLMYALPRSVGWPYFIFISGFSLILFLTVTVTHISKKGSQLAYDQIKLYSDTGKCADKFNSKNVGCFRLENIDGAEHFVIANPETHLLYLSRKIKGTSKLETCNTKYLTTLHIHEKEPEKQYSIDRIYNTLSTMKKESCDL